MTKPYLKIIKMFDLNQKLSHLTSKYLMQEAKSINKKNTPGIFYV